MKRILLSLLLASAACGAETLDITKDWRAMPVKAAANADVAKVLPEKGAWTDGAALAGKIPLAEGAKAGNLNAALARSSSPYVVTFDADMIPQRKFLLKTIPYFVDAERINASLPKERRRALGFVQTPQSFYTPDVFQHNLYAERVVPNEQDYFYDVIEAAKTSTNSVIYGGSNTILSRTTRNSYSLAGVKPSIRAEYWKIFSPSSAKLSSRAAIFFMLSGSDAFSVRHSRNTSSSAPAGDAASLRPQSSSSLCSTAS